MKTFLRILFFSFLITQICFAQWMKIGLDGKSAKDITIHNSIIFVVTSDSGKLFRSTDNGTNWTTLVELGVIDIDGSPSRDVFMLKDSINNSGPKQLFHSIDAGNTWIYLNLIEQIPNIYNISGPYSVKVNPTGTIFCMYVETGPHVYQSQIAQSTDNGLLWARTGISGGLVYDFRGNSVITSGWGACDMGPFYSIYLSDDSGLQWSELGLAPLGQVRVSTLKLCLNGDILAGICDVWAWGLFISDDSCNSWVQVSTISPKCGLSIKSSGMLVGTDSLGIFLFAENGDSLGSFNEGLTNLNVQSIAIDTNDYVYIGTDDGIWRRPLSEIVTSVEEIPQSLPVEFLLSQNYPNPFNPKTTIKYSIPKSSQVILKIFNTLGEEIEILANEEKPVGTYEVNWDAANFPSGVYFYRLQAGDFVQTKKMILLK